MNENRFAYKGSTKFSFESLLHEKQTVGDFASTHMKEDAPVKREDEFIPDVVVSVDENKLNVEAVYGSLRGLDSLFGFNCAENVINFTNQMYDPENFASILNTLGISVGDNKAADIETNKDQIKLAASYKRNNKNRYLESLEDDKKEKTFVIYFQTPEEREDAIKVLQSKGLDFDLNVYRFEDLNGDPDETVNKSFQKMMMITLRLDYDTAKDGDFCIDILEAVLESLNINYLRIRNY